MEAVLPAPKVRLNGTAISLIWTAVLVLVWIWGEQFSLPALSEIPAAWVYLVKEQGLIYELGVSFWLNIKVLILSTVIAVGLGWLSVDYRFRFPAIVVSKWRFFGMAGFTIVFQRMFEGSAMKVAMLTFIVMTFYTTSMLDVVVATRGEYDHARSLRMGKWRSIAEVVMLGKLGLTFDALRQNASIGWMSLTMVEGLSKYEGGIGVIMLGEQRFRNIAAIIAAQLTVLVVGIIQDIGIAWLKGVVCPYTKLDVEPV